MESVTIQAAAKINLMLDIIGTDHRGYHLMEMVMQSVDLCDTVELALSGQGIRLGCDDPSIPCDSRNIAYRCARKFFETIDKPANAMIYIHKRIPQQAGMAGGSADGAAVLVGCNHLFGNPLSQKQLCEIGEQIGADIPFCIIGGTARVEGIGEKITPLPLMPECSLVIAKPRQGISTQRAFSEYDRLGMRPFGHLEAMSHAIAEKDLASVCQLLCNSLEEVSGVPEIQQIKNLLKDAGAKGALMTGSGSAVFGIFTDRKKAYDCEQRLKIRYPDVFLCNPISWGCQISK